MSRGGKVDLGNISFLLNTKIVPKTHRNYCLLSLGGKGWLEGAWASEGGGDVSARAAWV